MSSDEEMPYEKAPRTRIREWQDSKPSKALVTGLPVKLGDGRVQATGKAVRIDSSDTEEDEDDVSLDDDEPVQLSPPPEDVSTAARFGRLAVVDVLTMSSRQSRINSAKDQIAGICQDIGADPENGVSSTSVVLSFYTCLTCFFSIARSLTSITYVLPSYRQDSRASRWRTQ